MAHEDQQPTHALSPVTPTLPMTDDQLRHADNELSALISSEAIVKFLKEKAISIGKGIVDSGLNWATVELLKLFGIGRGPSDLEQIKTLLKEILAKQEEILRSLDNVLREVQFQHLVTRGFESVQRILNLYETLQRLSLVKDHEERKRVAEDVKRAALDVNSGALISIKNLSDVLTGRDQLGKSDSLIKLFADRWYDKYHPQELEEKVPLSDFYGVLDQWLREIAIIQYMGVSALANARLADEDKEMLKQEMDAVVGWMEAQQIILDEQVPAWTRTLPAELKEEGSFWSFTLFEDPKQAIYGPFSPPVGEPLLRLRSHDPHNYDEQWACRSVTGYDLPSDVFKLFMRHGNLAVNLTRKHELTLRAVEGSFEPWFRLIMGRNPSAPPDTSRAHAFVPVLGHVNTRQHVARYSIFYSDNKEYLRTSDAPVEAVRWHVSRRS